MKLDSIILVATGFLSICLLGIGTSSVVIYSVYDLNNTEINNNTSYNTIKQCIESSRFLLIVEGILSLVIGFILIILIFLYFMSKEFEEWVLSGVLATIMYTVCLAGFSGYAAFECQKFNYLYFPIWNCIMACFSICVGIISVFAISYCLVKMSF